MAIFQRRSGDSESVRRAVPVNGWLPQGIGVIVIAVVVFILLYASVAYVPSGHVGVLTLFGRVTGEVLPEGTHLVNPFKINNPMSIRTQEQKETASVPSSEGLIISLDTSLLFRLNAAKAAEVYQKVGLNYVDVVVEPNLRSTIRAVTAAHTASALYTGGREEVAQTIQTELEKQLDGRGVIVENVLLRDVQLPAMLKASIEAKQQAEQDALRMNFVLQKEKQEAERKRIEATERLATSNNAKVVLIGNTKNGLPLILEPK